MRETRTDESRVCVAKAVLARLTSPSLKKSSWFLLLSLILLFSPTLMLRIVSESVFQLNIVQKSALKALNWYSRCCPEGRRSQYSRVTPL